MVLLLAVIGRWLYANVVGNEVASLLALVAAWFWKVRPHFKAQAEHRAVVAEHIQHARQHRLNVESWFEGLHVRLDAAGIPDVAPEQTGAHGMTDTFAAVTEEAT